MRIAGCGCVLADFLFNHVDFHGEKLAPYLSREKGDGGLAPGRLVFLEAFEKYIGKSYEKFLAEVVGEREPDGFNVGGPAIVALILAAQLLQPHGIATEFYGAVGRDDIGRRILDIIRRTPLDIGHLETRAGISPFTLVFSDPNFDEGHGERAFINNIGAAGAYLPEEIPDRFFEADVTLFGATGLVPGLHDNLTALLERGRAAGCLTVVTTVYDFRSEMQRPGAQWPLGDSQEGWPLVDLFIADNEEALRLSGRDTIETACAYFIEQGCGAFAVTHGPNPVHYYSSGRLFAACPLSRLPVSGEVARRLREHPEQAGDTTGCGDNFAGAMLASLALQRSRGLAPGSLNLPQAVALGIAAGGNACFHLGGIVNEDAPGRQARGVAGMYEHYRKQVGERVALPPAEIL